jgi:RNA polymerase sigma factor (sigma-70 family)
MVGRTIAPHGATSYAYRTVSSIITSYGRHNNVTNRHTGYRSVLTDDDEIIDYRAQDAMDQIEEEPIRVAIQALPPREREVVMLQYYLDLSVAEIAERMGVIPGTVKSSSSRARAALKRALTDT